MSLKYLMLLLLQIGASLAIGVVYSAVVFARVFWQILWDPRKLFNTKLRSEPPPCLKDPAYGTHGFIHLNEVRLHYVASGQEGKPLMLFLHGFPEFWYSWRYQIKEFQRDYRVVAVDMRGYGESDKPSGVMSYSVTKLVEDVREMIPALGYQKCTLVAHDWGGALAWPLAAKHPEMLDRVIIMNCPNPGTMMEVFRSHPEQFKKSWYMFFFQVPYLPEIRFRFNDYEMVEHVFKGWAGVQNDHVTQEDVEAYKYSLSREGGLTGPINYYRAAFRTLLLFDQTAKPIEVPLLLIWGCQDAALERVLAELCKSRAKDIEVHYIGEASHWVQMDTPVKVNEIMRDWLKRHNISG